jgi:hypothetical protein
MRSIAVVDIKVVDGSRSVYEFYRFGVRMSKPLVPDHEVRCCAVCHTFRLSIRARSRTDVKLSASAFLDCGGGDEDFHEVVPIVVVLQRPYIQEVQAIMLLELNFPPWLPMNRREEKIAAP